MFGTIIGVIVVSGVLTYVIRYDITRFFFHYYIGLDVLESQLEVVVF